MENYYDIIYKRGYPNIISCNTLSLDMKINLSQKLNQKNEGDTILTRVIRKLNIYTGGRKIRIDL